MAKVSKYIKVGDKFSKGINVFQVSIIIKSGYVCDTYLNGNKLNGRQKLFTSSELGRMQRIK